MKSHHSSSMKTTDKTTISSTFPMKRIMRRTSPNWSTKMSTKASHFALRTITIEELLQAQLTDTFCSEISSRLNKGERLAFVVHDRSISVRTSDKCNQIVALHSLKERSLYISHHPKLAAHPAGRKLYHRIRKDFYWPILTVD